jgi:hypothetical protein
MYIPKYFKLYELVGPEFYALVTKQKLEQKAFGIFDTYLLITADLLRERYGTATINNWFNGGSLKERGLREMNTGTGAVLSAHKFARAFDMNFKNATAEEVREDMRKGGCFKPGFRFDPTKGFECFKNIHRVESTMDGKPISWFHMDRFNHYNEDGSIVQLHV